MVLEVLHFEVLQSRYYVKKASHVLYVTESSQVSIQRNVTTHCSDVEIAVRRMILRRLQRVETRFGVVPIQSVDWISECRL